MKAILIIILTAAGMAFGSWVFQLEFNWFIAETFETREITTMQALGLMMVSLHLRANSSKENTEDDMFIVLGRAYVLTAIILLMSSLVRFVMVNL